MCTSEAKNLFHSFAVMRWALYPPDRSLGEFSLGYLAGNTQYTNTEVSLIKQLALSVVRLTRDDLHLCV
jgi:hypothetical protein